MRHSLVGVGRGGCAGLVILAGRRSRGGEGVFLGPFRRGALLGVLGLVCGVLLPLAVRPSDAFAASWAAGVEAPVPANAGASPFVRLMSVSCAPTGDCSAVGSYTDSSGQAEGLLLSETAGTWAPGVEAALPAGAASNPYAALDSVSCASAGNCSAVGSYTDSSGETQGLLLNETGGAWATGAEAILPLGAGPVPNVLLDSVSCASAGNCSAVGDYTDSSGQQQGLLLSESGGRWAAGIKATLPANAGPSPAGWHGLFPDADLTSVSCASAGNCSAVGFYFDSSGDRQGLVLSETAGKWATGVEAPLPANDGSNPFVWLDSVSCASAGNCSAVGFYTDSSGQQQGLLLSETGGRWTMAVGAALPAGARSSFPDAALTSVSCASAGNCSAVGFYTDSSGQQQGLLLSETAGTGATGVEASPPANAGSHSNVELDSVSCASAGNCSAVGDYFDSSGDRQGLLLSKTAGKWATGVEAFPPINAGSNPFVELDSVSCASAGNCSAAGVYTDSSGNQPGLLFGNMAVLSRLRVSPKTFVLAGRRVRGRCVKQSADNRTHRRCSRPTELTVSYTLNMPARVTIAFERVLPGRLLQRYCLAPTRKNRKHRRCTRLVILRGILTENATEGANSFIFTGRIGGRKLAASLYRLTATPQANEEAGASRMIAFKIAA